MKNPKIKTVFSQSSPESRSKDIEKAMHLVWGSLQSHLKYGYEATPEGQTFNKACVQEYAEVIHLLSKLY